MNEQTVLPIAGATATDAPTEITIDRAEYRLLIAARWHGEFLRDAARNLKDFEEIRPQLVEALTAFKRDPFLKDLSDKCHNPDGTLTEMLWKLQEALAPDKSSLYPLLDFEETHQKVFLRRGLIAFCTLLLRAMDAHPKQ